MYFEIKMQFSPPKHVKLFHSANRLDPVNCCFRKGTDKHAGACGRHAAGDLPKDNSQTRGCCNFPWMVLVD